MNHLCGLDIECPTRSLPPSDAAALAAFRGSHEAAKPTTDAHADANANAARHSSSPEKQQMLQQSHDEAVTVAHEAPAVHEVDPSTLPPCGWRPLDDATLYRFLCADRRNGAFQPDKSSARLRRALSFRKEEGVDGILQRRRGNSADSTERQKQKNQKQEGAVLAETIPMKKGPSPRSVVPYGRSDSVASLTSLASGTMTDDGGVRDLNVRAVSQPQPSPVAATAAATSELRPPRIPPRVNDNANVPRNDDESAEEGGGGSTQSSTTATTTTATATATALAGMCPDDLSRYLRLRVRVFVGRDRTGQPVLFERLGHFLGSGNCVHYTEAEWIKLYIWDLERHFTEMRTASEQTGRAITRFTYVADAEGIVGGIMNRSIWKVLPLLKALTGAVEEHYPEIADKIILFNVPRIASVFYRAVRTFLDPITAEKIELHSGVPTAELERIMPKSVIPVEYGGTNGVHYPAAVTE